MIARLVSLVVLVEVLHQCGPPALDGGRRETRWISDAGLRASGFGRVSFVARDGNRLEALTYRGSAFDPAAGPIWFVMHGASRDVDRYIRIAAPIAERHQALVIAIHFSAAAYPSSTDYTLGIDAPGGGWRAPEDMLYAEIEHVFDLVRRSLGGRQPGYHLFGHSAGAQFTHRLLTFLPAPRVLSAVAANAGWYTLPTDADPRLHAMPYGLSGGPVEPSELARLFATRLTILLGEHDTATAADDELVRGTPEAEAQGAHRLARGRQYFAVGQAQAASLGAEFAWRLEIAPGAEHDAGEVIWSAGLFTFTPAAPLCTTTTGAAASGLVITEILADPPAEVLGDANRDGVRDPADDEFVEIVNRGPDPVCLAGWTIGDAANPKRHVFPLGAPLEPGQVVIVFGGGVPTGTFSGATVQAAHGGLSLQTAGDVLTLRAADGAIVQQVSWGDCAAAPCAADHWPGSLEIDASLARSAQPGAAWAPHASVAGVPYSPGVATGIAASRRRS